MGGAEVNANPFEQVANAQLSAAAKARHRGLEKRMAKLVVQSERDAPMVASPADKEAYEKSAQFRLYKKHFRERTATLRSRPEFRSLFAILDDLNPSSPTALIAWAANVELQQADKHDVLAVIGDKIATFRIEQGLAPFDDSLPFTDEPPTAFQIIRFHLTGVGALS